MSALSRAIVPGHVTRGLDEASAGSRDQEEMTS